MRFLGRRRDYWRLLTRGAALLMVTLGIYRFWLTTDVRRFLWGNTELAGETLEYAGTPFELLIGFLAAIAILIPVYAGFFVAALGLGPIGQASGVVGFAALFVLGQYAIYRARRYRLTRTIYRGLRFHQEGSAWAYALRAIAWWIATVLTLGLAYPFQLASLERFKMRNTYYGDLAGHFAGSGFGLFFRGLPMWVLVVAPVALAVGAFVEVVDWTALADALGQGGDDVMARIEGGNPALGNVIVFAMLMGGTTVGAAALLYPAFQALVIRWWTGGLRFGALDDALHAAHRPGLRRLYALPVVGAAVFPRAGGRRAAGAVCHRPRRRQRHRRRDRRHRHRACRLCDRGARLFHHLPRHRHALFVAIGHGIAAIVGPLGARYGAGARPGLLAAGRGPGRRAQCGRLLMPDGHDTTQMTSGAGIFFDGRTSARHDARVTLGAEALRIEGADGRPLAQWRYDDIQELSAPAGVLRLGRRDSDTLERLEITDAAFAAAIDVRAIHVDRTGALQRRQRANVIGWTVAATASLVAVAYFGVPALADRLAPLVPVLAERKLGDAVDVQVRARLDSRSSAPASPAARRRRNAPAAPRSTR